MCTLFSSRKETRLKMGHINTDLNLTQCNRPIYKVFMEECRCVI
jgi:hypothetical protein